MCDLKGMALLSHVIHSPVVDMDSQENLVEKNERFDSQFCRMICRIAAVGCLIITSSTAILLTTVHPSKCPGSTFSGSNGTSLSVWGFFAITGLWALVVSYYAITWRRFAQHVMDTVQWGKGTYVAGRQPTWYGDWTQFNAMCASLIISTRYLLW